VGTEFTALPDALVQIQETLVNSMQTSGDFSLVSANACAPPVAPGGSCTVQVTFTPTATGSRTGSLTIMDNAPGSPQSVSLSGTGVSPNLGLSVASGGSISATVAAGGTATYKLTLARPRDKRDSLAHL